MLLREMQNAHLVGMTALLDLNIKVMNTQQVAIHCRHHFDVVARATPRFDDALLLEMRYCLANRRTADIISLPQHPLGGQRLPLRQLSLIDTRLQYLSELKIERHGAAFVDGHELHVDIPYDV